MIDINITSTLPNPIIEGASVILTCIVGMGELVESDLKLINLEVTLYRNGSIPMNLSQAAINGTTSTYAYAHQIVSFNRDDSGNYSCEATARPHPSSVFINDSNASSGVLNVTTGS